MINALLSLRGLLQINTETNITLACQITIDLRQDASNESYLNLLKQFSYEISQGNSKNVIFVPPK